MAAVRILADCRHFFAASFDPPPSMATPRPPRAK